MRKEVFIAILIGLILGGAVAFGIWRANLALVKEEVQTEQSATPFPQEQPPSSLIITQPENNTVLGEDKVTVKGAATPNANIVFLTNEDEIITQATREGTFEQEVELIGGANEIIVIAYDDQGNESRSSVVVVYSTEFTE